MTTLRIPVTAVSVQSARPGQRYGQLAHLPVRAGQSAVLLRAALSRVPAGATVISATLQVSQWSIESGSRTLHLSIPTSNWTSNVTWAKRPSVGSDVAVKTITSPQRTSNWSFDITTPVQQVVSGNRADFGWQLAGDTGNGGAITVRGSTAAVGTPVIVVDYTLAPLAPENLHPSSGLVSVAKPVLTFDASDRITALQVQLSTDSTTGGVVFDSGTVAAAGGYLDLAGTTYAGLAAGATVYWRARQQVGGGWSDWSLWVSMTRLTKPTLTITSPPDGVVDDGTPPITWTFTGTEVAWQARLLDSNGDVLADSGYTPGSDLSWTPDTGLKRNGQQGTIELLVWDDQDRLATPGDPEYVIVTKAITYTLDPTVGAVSTLTASQPNTSSPRVVLTGTRPVGVPDEVDVFRDGDRIARYAGVDVFSGTSFTIVDFAGPMGRPVTYRVAPRVNGKTAAGGPVRTITPVSGGIWLIDAEGDGAGDIVYLYALRENPIPEQTQPESAIVHTPLNLVEGAGQVVRRRMVRFRDQGTITGGVADLDPTPPDAPDAATSEIRLRDWAERDAGHRYKLLFGGYSGNVIIGDLTFTERNNPHQERGRQLGVSFNYWGQA